MVSGNTSRTDDNPLFQIDSMFSKDESYYDVYMDKSYEVDTVCGCEEAKIQINDVLDILKNKQKYDKIGAKLPRGILLEGKPGTGKTLMVRSLASKCNLPIIIVHASNLCDTYVGVGPKRVKKIFTVARKLAPCLIFVDEIDSIGTDRKYNSSGGDSEKTSTLNAILNELDGFKKLDNIILFAATNKSEELDPALTRPGRFDRKITVITPDLISRIELFKYYLSKIRYDFELNNISKEFAKLTPGFTGADISNIVNESALIAVRNNRNETSKNDINEAYEIHILGHKKLRGNLSEEEINIVAYHEAGHAFLQYVLTHVTKVSRVSIEPRVKSALGYSQSEPNDKNLSSKLELIHRISICLGGRLVEHILNPDLITTGAYDDLLKVNELITQYVQIFGFDEKYGNYVIKKKYNNDDNCSDQNKFIIEKRCKFILNVIQKKTLKILNDNFEKIKLIAEHLKKYKNIYAENFEKLLGIDNFDSITIDLQKTI
jgi:ATP-dependent metalloprotease FtsH